MHQFGLNLEGESLEGLKTLECDKCKAYPCECICKSKRLLKEYVKHVNADATADAMMVQHVVS